VEEEDDGRRKKWGLHASFSGGQEESVAALARRRGSS
jgi:hypothetical protein